MIHIVRPGETLFSIAAEYGVAPGFLAGQNGLAPGAALAVGQALAVRVPAETYTVAPGDTLFSVAARAGLSVRELYRRNYALLGRSTLVPGETLALSYRDEAKLGTLSVNGYAYPYIDIGLLDSVLPYLTYLTPFTYGISETGQLVPLGDAELLTAAGLYGAQPLMHLSTLTEEGSFSNDRASALLESPALQEQLLQSVVQNLRRRGYYGLDVDFEYVYPRQREAYAAFVGTLRERLAPFGYPVFAALAPKTRADQPGLLYEAHDYALLGAAADAVLVMAYEWGYAYGPPMAVAPLPQVRAVLNYAVTEVPRAKLLLGVPFYGYDWTLPFEAGVSKADSLSPQRAVELAVQYRAEIEYDETAQAPYFYYTPRSGRSHIVWFEDARSCDAKLRLVREYGLRGIGVWNLMRPFPQGWAALDSLYVIEKA